MTQENKEKNLGIINCIGGKKVEEIYSLLGPEKISFSLLKRLIVKTKVAASLHSPGSISDIAKRNQLSKWTIYREMKKSCKS